MNPVLTWIWENIWQLIAVGILLRYGKRLAKIVLFDPLAGGNGKVQMDELAKAIILAVFVFSAYIEATRITEHHVFSDTYFFSLLLSVCAIAAIKPVFENMKNFRKDDENKKE